jgi:hypothetical protein
MMMHLTRQAMLLASFSMLSACGTAGPKDEASLISSVTAAYAEGDVAALTKLHLAPERSECAGNAKFQARMKRAHADTREKFDGCKALGVGASKPLRVRRQGESKQGPVHGCGSFHRAGDLQVYFDAPGGGTAYAYLDDVVRDDSGVYWLANDIWCRKVRPVPKLAMALVGDEVTAACACPDAACFRDTKQGETAMKSVLTMILSKGLDDEAYVAEHERYNACGRRLGVSDAGEE